MRAAVNVIRPWSRAAEVCCIAEALKGCKDSWTVFYRPMCDTDTTIFPSLYGASAVGRPLSSQSHTCMPVCKCSE